MAKFTFNKIKVLTFFTILVLIIATFWLGLYLGMKTQPRTLISLDKCEKNCLSVNEFAGMIGSVGISLNGQKPVILKENENCFSIKMPFSRAKLHYVIIPKTDIKDLGDLTDGDSKVVQDCINIAIEHIQQERLENYYFRTNGPERQDVRYLHFHLETFS